MNETFKPVPGYEGYYEVSNLGNVRSVGRKTVDKNGIEMNFKGKERKSHPDPLGYMKVALFNGVGTKYTAKVHRIVALAFIPNPENKPQINHIDSNRANNCVSNLEWCTHSENQKHSYKHGNGKYRLNNRARPVIHLETGIFYDCLGYCAKALGIHPETLRNQVAGLKGKNYRQVTYI